MIINSLIKMNRKIIAIASVVLIASFLAGTVVGV